MIIPASTYRVQLHKGFTFKDLERIIDYLDSLGITTIYAAPIFRATPGSMHGYDITDPHSINPDIGTIVDLKRIAVRLKEKKMSWIQDIVPNHMAFHTQNFRLMDVLERGEWSPYYQYFDILWDHPAPHLKGKLQVPFLGKSLKDCVESNEITIGFSAKGFTVDYFRTSFPLSINAYDLFLPRTAGFRDLPAGGKVSHTLDAWTAIKGTFISNIREDEQKHFEILRILEVLNADKGKVSEVLDQQHYLLSYWKDTEHEIGYRRFFTVNELICLRMENERVFNEYHSFLHSLYQEGLIQGVRIDHIDGLKDPAQYTGRLRKLLGDDCYIIAEKILEAKENIPGQWPLQGTSGYEFLSHINQLITNRNGAKQLLTFYKTLVPGLMPYKDLVFQNKQLILAQYMAGEWKNIVDHFISLGLSENFKHDRLKKAIGLLMVCLPVYRIYPDRLPLAGEQLQIMKEAFAKANVRAGELKSELEYLKNLFTENSPKQGGDERVLCFLQRLMQFTGPLTAKGVEDTTFYIYNALISHDEVGDAPSTLGISVNNFHTKMVERQRSTPLSLNATATHDTKRGEDSRLRLNVLCEFPEDWQQMISEAVEINRPFHRRLPSGKLAPVINDEYFIYQAISGGFPEGSDVNNEWLERLQAYLIKVVREAKEHSDWGSPDEAYEGACHFFIRSILLNGSDFMKSFLPFISKVVDRSNRLAVAQVLIKITSPGIPDIYQGCELWDLSFVDPDNRRPVDYLLRMDLLDRIISKEREGTKALFSFLKDERNAGAEKMFAVWKALHFRRSNRELFVSGTYIPLQLTEGGRVTIAYARRLDNSWVIIVAPLFSNGEMDTQTPALPIDAEIILPEGSSGTWRNVFTGERVVTNGRLALSACFNLFHVAMLTNIRTPLVD
jgi:(1->4)-alpha-D-glucan 1-alpha-D-glucosylmutase